MSESEAAKDVAQSKRPVPESVWDYPRPPRMEPTAQRLRVVHAGVVLAETQSAMRVLETSHPPVFYFPPGDVRLDLLRPSSQRKSFCEFKGVAAYWDLEIAAEGESEEAVHAATPGAVHAVAWSYRDPAPRYADLRDHLAFYAGRVDECTVDGERVQAQRGSFYGGWITSAVSGPFKG